jgi:hypothetical protein
MKTYQHRSEAPYQIATALTCILIIGVLSFGRLMAAPRPPVPPWPEAGRIYVESFNEPYGMATDQIDPTMWAESWSGYCLERSLAPVTPWVIPLVVTNRTQVDPVCGAIRFWYRPGFDSGSGPGTTAVLLTLGSGSGSASVVWWTLAVSTDGGTVSLACQSGDGVAVCLSAPVAFAAGNWYLLTLGYSGTNSALYINDGLAATGGGVAAVPAQVASSTSLVVGSDALGEEVAAGQIDELSVFSGSNRLGRLSGSPFGLNPQSSIVGYYAVYSPIAALGPIPPEEQTQRMASRAMGLTLSGPPAPGGGSGSGGGGTGGGATPMNTPVYTDADLWLELIAMTNGGGLFVVHPPAAEATNGVYDLFMTTNLSPYGPGLNLTNWVWLLRTEPGETNLVVPHLWREQAFFLLGRTNDTDGDGMSDAYEELVSHTDPNVPDGPVITFQPLSQDVDSGDTVTFAVTAEGAQPLAYQWLLDGTNLAGATGVSLTISSVQMSQAGDYSVQVTSPARLSVVSSNATLTVEDSGYWPVIALNGARQDYTFKSGVTYYVGSSVELYGATTIQGGAIIKPDWYFTNATLAVMGTLVCKTEDAYYPAFLTSVDDDTVGDLLWFSTGQPQAATNGCPYLDLSCAQDGHPSLSNLRIRYADQGVTIPAGPQRVDIWDCQFFQCNAAVVAGQGGTAAFHNVLLAACGAAVAAATNYAGIEGEHVTADVTNFWAGGQPGWVSLTNSIVVGGLASGPALVTDHVAINPAGPVFQTNGSANYYLAAGGPYRAAGTPNISPRLLAEFCQKSTQPPVAFPAMMQVAGELTLGPQAARYVEGAPDIGYWYNALDYTVAILHVNGGTINVLPGTAIGLRNDYVTYQTSGGPMSDWTYAGFYLWQGATFTSRGTPTRPNTFAKAGFAQETPGATPSVFFIPYFVPPGDFDFMFPNGEGAPPPTLDFRFSNFYLDAPDYHLWSGFSWAWGYLMSPDSAMFWNLQDCALHGGGIIVSTPDADPLLWEPFEFGAGSITWQNNLFDLSEITLMPSYWPINGGINNVDMPFTAYNNLFRNGVLDLEPVPTSQGNWLFSDNLFDNMAFNQVATPALPLDHDYNGYWLRPSEALNLGETNRLRINNSDGSIDAVHDVVLPSPPPYQRGPFGDYYLPPSPPLFGGGSRTPTDAGLYHYTTRRDQVKEGEEEAGHNVNIGLHYIATAGPGSSQPRDTDGDGIPDYVENWHGDGNYSLHTDTETDWQNPMTDGVNPDPYNTIYDDIDLSGDGLVGRIKKALGMNPLDASNPLAIRRVITGQEPDIATFQVPVSYDTLTNIGQLQLYADSAAVPFQECTPDTNGNCLLLWNTTFKWPGRHFLAAQLTLNGQLQQGTTPDSTVLSGFGQMASFYSYNIAQFDPFYSGYDTTNGAILYAELPEPDADYSIELRTPSGEHIKTISGSTSSGIIKEHWDVTDESAAPYTGHSVDAVFSVTLLDPDSGTNTVKLHEDADEVPDGDFTVAYAWDNNSEALGLMWDAMQDGVVDPLIQPTSAGGENDDPYISTYNDFTWWGDLSGNPGYLTDQAAANYLFLTNLVLDTTVNFYFDGHGSSTALGDGPRNQLVIGRGVVEARLHNKFDANGVWNEHPYRFVFLNACDTADDPGWAHTFGICDRITTDELSDRPDRVQAFVGWNGEPRAPQGNEWYDEAITYELFFNLWMAGYSLHSCIYISSQTNPTVPPYTLNFPLGKKFDYPYNGVLNCNNHFHIRIYGYAGICRTGYIAYVFDNSQYYQ